MDPKRLKAAVHTGRIGDILDALDAARELRWRRWLRDRLRIAVEHADPGSLDEATRARLLALGWTKAELAEHEAGPPRAAVHVPLVPVAGSGTRDEDGGAATAATTEAAGFFRLMWVSYDPSGNRALRERYDAAARAAVADGLLAASDALGGMGTEGYAFLPVRAGTLAKLEIAGASLGAAAAVAAASLWSQRPVRPGTAVTGRIAGDRIAAVGGMQPKVLALAERPDVTRLVVPSQDLEVAQAVAREHGIAAEVLGASTVGELLEVALEPEPRLDGDPEHAVAEARRAYDRGWQGWRWPQLLERFERLASRTPARRPDLKLRALAMLGATHRNLGDPAAALGMLEEALAILQTEEAEVAVPDDARTFLYRHLAVTLRQLCRFEEALSAAREAERHARHGRLRGDLAFALGTRGLVHLSLEQTGEAVASQREAMQHLLRHAPRYAPRTGSYLVQALGRAGRPEEARERYRESLQLAARFEDEGRRRTDEQWLRTQLAGALRDEAFAGEVRELLSAPCLVEAMAESPMPGLLARRWLGLAEVALGERRTGYARLAASPMAHPQARDPQMRFLAHLNVLFEGRARLEHDELHHDATARVRHALEHLPQTDAAADFLSPAAADVLAALERAEEPAQGSARPGREEQLAALDRLVEACARLE